MNLMKATLSRLWRLTRATSIVMSLAVMVALVAGTVSLAGAAPSSSLAFLKGVENTVSRVTSAVDTLPDPILRLDNNGTGPALDLQVERGKAPMTVNSDAGTATNLSADMIDGQNSTAFLGATQKAADSDKLGGIDSTGFVHGNGTVYQGEATLDQGAGFSDVFLDTRDPRISLQYFCPNDVTQNGVIVILNRTFFEAGGGENVRLFIYDGSANPTYQVLDSARVRSVVAAPEGEHVTFQVEALGPKIVTIEVFSVQRPSSGAVGAQCSVQAQATVTR